MKQFGKILKFELNGYFKNKAFLGITIFLLVAVVIAMFIPNITALFESEDADGDGIADMPVMLIYSENASLASISQQYFASAFVGYDVKLAEGTLDDVKSAVSSGDVECAFVMNSASSYTYFVNNLSMYDVNAEMANSVLQEVYRYNAMVENGLTPEQAGEIMAVQIESNTEVLGKDQMQNYFYTYIMIFALYFVILLYGQMVANNVATEKSSRAMELLVTSAKPASMMFGKVIATCIAGATQLIAVFGTAILCYNINKDALSNPIVASIFSIPGEMLGYMLLFFVLGFFMYAFMYGAVGSVVSKLEDVGTMTLPINFMFVATFAVVISSMGTGDMENMMMKIGSFIPFTSPVAMFARICMSTVPWYEILISVLVLLGSTIAIGFISAKIYRVGVLLYGTRPKFKDLLKTVFAKEK